MPSGLLYSQIGYDAADPVRVVYRASHEGTLSSRAELVLTSPRGHTYCRPMNAWGARWGAHWWTAQFPAGVLPADTYTLALIDLGRDVASDTALVVAPDRLFTQTFPHVALGCYERRTRIAKVKPGWYDAGVLWQESNSHSASVLGFADLLLSPKAFSPDDRRRLVEQLCVGSDYLLNTQTRAKELGRPDGAMVHDLLDLQHMCMVADVSKGAAALARAARALPPERNDRAAAYRTAAARALRYCLAAKPAGPDGFLHIPHGVPESFVAPHEHRTSDLLMMLFAAVELARSGSDEFLNVATDLAQQVLARQVPGHAAEQGLYGHFYTFSATHKLTEKAWTHTGARHPNGSDNGQSFPHFVLPLLELLRLQPHHPHAPRWKTALHTFTHQFLLPACELSPFRILPLGFYPGTQSAGTGLAGGGAGVGTGGGADGGVGGGEVVGGGWLHFAALWHGMNCVYPLTAAIALELDRDFPDPRLREIAVANVQWIAGLNAGVTRSAMDLGSHMWSADLPDDRALPVSMIQGIGNRTAGCWTTIRGSICNGFGPGDQFRLDLAPTRANDAPNALHDEDWITHSAAWLSALARL